MQTQLQAVPQAIANEQDSLLLASLLNRDFIPAQSEIKAPEIDTGKRWQATGEIMGEIEVEREIDFGYSVCGICFERTCSCEPRIEQRFTQTIRYTVETAIATTGVWV